jgi:hypothetical protein
MSEWCEIVCDERRTSFAGSAESFSGVAGSLVSKELSRTGAKCEVNAGDRARACESARIRGVGVGDLAAFSSFGGGGWRFLMI